MSDFWDRVEHEEEARSRRGWAERLLQNARSIVLLLDTEARIVRFNQYLADLGGYDLEDVQGKSWFDLFLKDKDQERLLEVFRETLAAGASEATNDIVTRSGERRRIAWSNRVLPDSSGRPLGVLAFGQDVTELENVQRRLLEADAEMRAVVQTAAEGIITIDASGTIRSFNAAAERMFGYAADEVIGENISLLMPEPHRDEHDDYIRRYLETGVRKIIGIGREVFGRRKDGSVFPLHLALSEIVRGGSRAFAGILRDLSEQRQLERSLAEASAEERRRLAQDLHDSLGGHLAGITILADLLRKRLAAASSPEVERASQLVDAIREAHEHLRRISRGILPVEADPLGLMASLRMLAQYTQELNEIPCEFICDAEVEIADQNVATHLFHIAEEAVQNAVRHASASSLSIRLRRDGPQVWLVVCDDGIGIRDHAGRSKGLGLRTMKYRAGLIDANLDVRRAEGCGTCVECSLSVSERG